MKWTPRSIRALDMTLTKHMQAQGHNFSYPQNLSSRPDPYLSEPQSTFDPDFSQHNNSSLFLNGTQDFDKDFDSHHARGSALNDQQKRPEQSDYPWPRFPGELIRSDSEADSLIDLYRRPKSSTNMPPNMPPNIPSSSKAWKSVDPHTPSRDDSENSRWIHRDKLTMIEIQEYRDRGIEPPPELLRRAGISIEGGKDVKSNGQVERSKHSKKASLSSRPNSNGTNETIDEGFVPQDPRSPEEIATDPYDLSPGYHSSSLRSGSSRIPLSVSSPAPVPVEHLERSTPLPRKRGASGHWDEDALRYPKTRSRSQSVDDAEINGHFTSESWSLQSSPTKAGPSNKHTTSATKKTSVTPRNVSSIKQRVTSTTNRNSSSQRPGTRSGSDGRPSTAINRPEGDPPWLQDMYKPDPSLPPDQQILPTHAKRLMQEQWEKEGKATSPLTIHPDWTGTGTGTGTVTATATATATEHRAIHPNATNPNAVHPNVTGSRIPKPGSQVPLESSKESNGELGWPLKPVTSNEPTKSPSTEHAGYKTIPKIQSPAIGTMSSPKLQQSEHSPHLEQVNVEGKKEDKGCCGGCIVM